MFPSSLGPIFQDIVYSRSFFIAVIDLFPCFQGFVALIHFLVQDANSRYATRIFQGQGFCGEIRHEDIGFPIKTFMAIA